MFKSGTNEKKKDFVIEMKKLCGGSCVRNGVGGGGHTHTPSRPLRASFYVFGVGEGRRKCVNNQVFALLGINPPSPFFFQMEKSVLGLEI